jgi:hypothetical protein
LHKFSAGITIWSRKPVIVIEANMIELVKSPSMRVHSKGCLALWLAVSLVLASLLFAVGAQAQGTDASGGAETTIDEMATKSDASPEEDPSGIEQAPATTEQTPPTAQETPPIAQEAPPATEQAPPVAQEAPPATGQAPPVAEQNPSATEKTPPTAQETPPVVEKKTVEQTTGEVAAEAGSEATQGSGENSQVPAGASGLTHKGSTGEVAPEISIAVTTSVAAAQPEISMPSVQDQPPLALRAQTISTRDTEQTSCVGASIVGGYAGGWLDVSVASSVSNIPFVAAEVSPTAIAAGAPAGSLGGGSMVENRPSVPGSGLGGGGGGSAAGGGGSGSASSASSTLVDVLLQAAPRAMRRLRLAQPSLRTSFFVLIPERPD